jgi:hypothetical protein
MLVPIRGEPLNWDKIPFGPFVNHSIDACWAGAMHENDRERLSVLAIAADSVHHIIDEITLALNDNKLTVTHEAAEVPAAGHKDQGRFMFFGGLARSKLLLLALGHD